jgi:hypothetical protein
LIKEQFRAELRQIIKCSLKNDIRTKQAMVINYKLPGGKLIDVPFRFGWWAKDTRPRLVPKYNGSESKLKFPVLYIGLSRLQPLGECEGNVMHSKVSEFLAKHKNYRDWIIEKYKYILSLHEVEGIEAHKHPVAMQKVFVGVKNKTYDELCNSAGQDNLGQILLAFLSFKNLQDNHIKNKIPWNGGILLVDELDATLHPAAQCRLLEVFVKEIEKHDLKLQIVFTTHSPSLLESFYTLPELKNNRDKYKVIYLTRANGDLAVMNNPDFEFIRSDMLITDPATKRQTKINIYSEDHEAKWLFNQLLKDTNRLSNYHIINMDISCSTLIKLNEEAPEDFSNSIILLDGDCRKSFNCKTIPFNIIFLPGEKRPESVIYDYLMNTDAMNPILHNPNFPAATKRGIEEFGPLSAKYEHIQEERSKYKKWFQDSEFWLTGDAVIDRWKKDCEKQYNDFLNQLNKVTMKLIIKKAKMSK